MWGKNRASSKETGFSEPGRQRFVLSGISPEFAAHDLIAIGFITSVIAIANALYVADLFMLWHDDNQSYYIAGLDQMTNRLSGDISRHYIVDNFLLHILANTSPFIARLAAILTGGIPLAILAYLVLRFGLFLRPEAAAFGAAGPLLVAGQWEIFVGVNLSYVVFDAAMFFAAVLLLMWARQANRWSVTVLASAAVAVSISDGMVSSLLLGPVLLWAVLFIRPRSLLQSALMASALIAATLKAFLEQRDSGRAALADEPWDALLRDLPLSLDFLLPGGVAWAWAALVVFALMATAGAVWSWRSRSIHPVLGLGLAAALYLVPVVIYSLFRPGFPNRYAFLPTIAVFIGLAVIIHFALSLLARQFDKHQPTEPEANWSLPSGVPGAIVLLILAGLAYHKSQYEAPIFTLISNSTRLVADYFNPPLNPIAGAVEIDTSAQLMVLSESGFPYMYPHRYPALGYLRFVTGNPRAVGFAGSRKLCADPFEEWSSPWEPGPGGFSTESPISAHAFRGLNGTGAALSHLLATPGNDLESSEAEWTLYEIGDFGARAVSDGEGRAELESQLADLGIAPHLIAFSCGL